MAVRYFEYIKEVQPEGPYLIAGYCMGGQIALEIAQQLKTEGHEVALLTFFETYNAAAPRRRINTIASNIRK